ncbi:SHOCT domain-containing protein [Helicovermis profundi]|uniref:SHOCT domain-containing protein n=1 Tax=Helicovermis profundi TaxID=3065157 RepID=A0AAU9ETE0_9FIRM|nr:hypothetical protein HLPR_06560 [Clostridia bacterium S502]
MFGREYYGCNSYNAFGYWNILMIIGWILILVSLIWIIKLKKKKDYKKNLIIELKNSFANGEIGEEEYLNKKNIINRRKV